MSILAGLGLDVSGMRTMLIDPPDYVLAEASGIQPRPTVVSSLQVAEPTMQIVWWPQQGELTTEGISKLGWMLSVVSGSKAWLVGDGEDASPSAKEMRAAVEGTLLRVEKETTFGEGGTALRLALVAG